jgi:rRNA pseudouridine-1189 N-methylase Emg1 (Nep1/Mra1 family)
MNVDTPKVSELRDTIIVASELVKLADKSAEPDVIHKAVMIVLDEAARKAETLLAYMLRTKS